MTYWKVIQIFLYISKYGIQRRVNLSVLVSIPFLELSRVQLLYQITTLVVHDGIFTIWSILLTLQNASTEFFIFIAIQLWSWFFNLILQISFCRRNKTVWYNWISMYFLVFHLHVKIEHLTLRSKRSHLTESLRYRVASTVW